MDRVVYVAMAGANQALDQHSSVSNNLANVSTSGFRAQLNAFRAVPLEGDGNPTRVFTVTSTPYFDQTSGPITQTGRDLDVAINGQGWFTVQKPDGSEAYTRKGSFQTDADGQLRTADGMMVVGQNGPIVVPPGSTVQIGKDGTVSALGAGQAKTAIVALGKLKMVNPPTGALERSDDGYFRLTGNNNAKTADADPTVTLVPGAQEGSNVNSVQSMVDLISLSRRFETQMKMIQTVDNNDQRANSLLSMNG
jgi:flagellar basal-body rod protein FlgF